MADDEDRESGMNPDESAGGSENGQLGFTVLGEFLENDGWNPRRMEENTAYSASYNGESGDFRCFAAIRTDLEEFLFYAVAPVRIPEAVRPAVSEFINRANYGMRIGNFEMDHRDGEIRYKSSLNFENQPLTPQLLRNAIYPAVQTIDRYLPGLMRVAFGGATPLEAVQEIEGDPQEKE